MSISCWEFRNRPIARYELLQAAEALGFPAVDYINAWGHVERLEGRLAWQNCGLVSRDGRRDAYRQLQAIEHRIVHGNVGKESQS